MLRIRTLFALGILALCVAFAAYAQEGGEKGGGFDFGLNIGIGADTFYENGDYVTYQKLTVSPDIAFGKFGIGLELTMHYTFTGGADNTSFFVRTEGDWVPGADQNVLDVYLPKFMYIRYGFKGEPLYVKLGSIEDGSLGNGFIMNNYDNTLFLPEKRIFGLAFDLDGSLFNFPVVGIETFVGNLARFDVMGFRPFVRPLVYTQIPILKNLQVGATLAIDTQPDLYLDTPPPMPAEPVILYGADLRLPILANPMISLVTFGDLAVLANRGSMGGMVGFGGRLIGFLDYGAQLRILGANFVPAYFDSSYDNFRYAKYQIAEAGAAVDPFVGWLGSLGFSFFNELLIFNASLDGPFAQPEPGNPDNYLNWPHLYAQFILGKGLIPNVSFDASYDKRSLGDDPDQGFFRDLISAVDAVIQARLNYSIGVAVLSFVYQIRYDPTATPNPWVTHSGIESSIQLF